MIKLKLEKPNYNNLTISIFSLNMNNMSERNQDQIIRLKNLQL